MRGARRREPSRPGASRSWPSAAPGCSSPTASARRPRRRAWSPPRCADRGFDSLASMRRVALCLALVTLAACSENSASVISPDVIEGSDHPDAAAPLDRTVVDVSSVQDQPAADLPDVVTADVVDAPAAPDVADVPPAAAPPSHARRGALRRGRAPAVAGCDEDRDCAGASGDGGATSQRCESVSHQCVECVRDEHCPAGFLCVGNLCAAGCNGARACPTGQSCCGGAASTRSPTPRTAAPAERSAPPPTPPPRASTAPAAWGRCDPGFASCDGDGANGCEANTFSATRRTAAAAASAARRGPEQRRDLRGRALRVGLRAGLRRLRRRPRQRLRGAARDQRRALRRVRSSLRAPQRGRALRGRGVRGERRAPQASATATAARRTAARCASPSTSTAAPAGLRARRRPTPSRGASAGGA